MKQMLKRLPLILFGNFLLSICVSNFVVPSGMISGGITGMALALTHIFTFIPLEVFIWGFSLLFLLAGFVFLGKEFALTTLISSIAYPLFFSLMTRVSAAYLPLTTDRWLSAVYAGLTFGIGAGLIIRCGASTGGSDVISMILNRKMGLPISPVSYAIEAFFLCTQIPFVQDAENVLFGLLFVLIYALTLEKTLLFGTGKVQIAIYSQAYEQINQMIVTTMDRGSTLFKVKGGYSGEETWVVETVVAKRQLFAFREKILAVDPK
ncbi:MAG: YitT family protein, partial [Oscillospiraceae bacterium]|nr:YitT family protein [Oscillospiraceae bacterium]